ncbi:MAG: OmpA family protein [Rhodobacteraceae bacterium]|nr:OmpA family protein [Paracoccaceae bacterium]
MHFLRAAVIAALFSVFQPSFAEANDVTLTSRDGSIELNGTLLGYDGEYYRVDTEYGILTVDGSGVLCDGPGCPGLGPFVASFTLSGAREMGAVLMPALVEGFAIRRGYALSHEDLAGIGRLFTLYEGSEGGVKAAEIIIRQASSTEGFAELLGEEADIALSLREISASEHQIGNEAGLGDLRSARQARVIALDALVPVVAPGNPVRHLSVDQLIGVFGGTIRNWQDLGGENAPITAYMLEDGEGFSDIFATLVASGLGGGVSPEVLRKPTNTSLVEAVANDPFGIGMAAYSQSGHTEIITLSGACSFEIAANPQSIRAEDYPLTAPLYIYLPARRLPKLAREFLAYTRSDAAQMVIRRAGLVHQMPEESPVDVQGRRLTNAIAAAGDEIGLAELKVLAQMMEGHNRLSLTFRFRGGSSALDAPSLSNVQLLARALEAGRFDGREVRFVGFTDGEGAAAANQRLALERARAVLQAVREAAEALGEGQVELNAEAFGEALPMACDDSDWGRQVNRRVEVWLK